MLLTLDKEGKMSKGKWTPETAQAIITRTGGIASSKEITEKSVAGIVGAVLGIKKRVIHQIWHPKAGIKVLGAIDFLIRKHGYVRVREK